MTHFLDVHDFGLAHDLNRITSQQTQRRNVLARLIVGSVAPWSLAGCGGGGGAGSGPVNTALAPPTATGLSGSTPPTTATPVTNSSDGTSCSVIPEETSGPYPADGTNTLGSTTVNALTQSGILRSNISSSFGSSTGTAVGIPLAIKLQLVNTGCKSLAGFAVYLWHCDQLGRYSLYSPGVTGENFLRGVQISDNSGNVSFTSIYPGCYAGRWPHIHFEVYSSTTAANSGRNAIKTSQIALPASANSQVYNDTNYTGSAKNYSSISLASDGIFSDGSALQTPTISGSVAEGYTINLQVTVAA